LLADRLLPDKIGAIADKSIDLSAAISEIDPTAVTTSRVGGSKIKLKVRA
jgi:hypothetical protein